MLQIDKVRQFGPVAVYGDSDQFNVFYVLPSQPRYRRNPDGTVAFRYVKYRSAVDRPGGVKAGGFVLFDAEFAVDEDFKTKTILPALADEVTRIANQFGISPVPPVVFGSITYTKGTTQIFFPSKDATVHNPGKPSLVGNMVATFAIELNQDDATLFEQAMQGSGGSVSVIFDVWFWARLPPLQVDGYWYASKFYSFYQTIDIDWNLWSDDSYNEKIREQSRSSESERIVFNWGPVSLNDDEKRKIEDRVSAWAYKALEAEIQRNMIEAIAPVPDDQRKVPDGIEHVTRDISSTKISNVSIHYTESQTVEWNHTPQGILENITELTDGKGKKLKWEDYFKEIDLDDPFFKELRVNTYVNADFEHLPIHSVEVKVIYNNRPMANLAPDAPEGEVVLSKPDDIGKFATFVENNNWKYTYSYQINYKGQSKIYQSPDTETNEGNLTIGVDDVGILSVDISAADLDWNDLDHALITFKYADDGVEPVEDQFQLNSSNLTHRVEHVIFQPMRKNYTYQVKYVMKNGREFNGPETSGRSQQLFINDVFGGSKTVSVRGVGDFAGRIANVFVQLDYTDAANGYSQTRSVALNSSTSFFDWTFPVVNPDAGEVTYSATVAYKDGTVQDVPKTPAKSNTIILPPATEAFLDIALVPDLVDWSAVKLARVSLSYVNDGLSVNKDYFFSPTKHDQATWHVELKDKTHTQYTYTANFFMMDGMKKTVGPKQSSDVSLVLDPTAS